jgi:hypothetical protein
MKNKVLLKRAVLMEYLKKLEGVEEGFEATSYSVYSS